MERVMHIAKQLAVFIENRPGTLARLCRALQAANVNIYAISTGDTVDHNVIRLVVSDTDKAISVFHEHNTMAIETEVLLVEGENKPGMLGQIAEKLAAAKINIEYCYCATSPNVKKGLLVIRASNTKKALKALNS